MTRVPRRFAGIGATDLANASAFDAYVGPAREVTVDQNRKIIALHDGVTAGGVRVLMSTQLGAVNGVASLDSSGQIPVAQLGPALLDTQLGVASGVASLDGDGYVPVAQLGNALKKGGDTTSGRYLFQRTSGTGASFSPDIEQDVSESFSAGTGFYIAHAVLATKTGGSGHREAVHVEQLSSSSAVGEFVVGIQGQGRITAGSGSAFGLNGYVWVDAAAAATVEASAAEFNTDIRRSGGIVRKVGIQIVDVSTSVGAGTAFDCGVLMTKQSGAIGFTAGIQFGDSSQFPVRAGGHVITLGAAGVAPTLATGVNLAALPAPTIGAFVSPPAAKGLSFGLSGEGGLIQSTTLTGGGILSFGNGTVGVNTSFEATGYRSRSGTSGSFGGNYLNLFWNTSTNKVDLYVDNSRIGSITTGA
ncbi:hypothetical protein G6L91_11520 [Agrobacterium rhizogenes]|uniref:hypothetical protein n=1 Tax=Rhizobium rhizogenes TaxID=359 RepID=UPI0015736433|nr:hypothetical protein [Rhizobium rhizogenes]NTF62096.1 hypothetical protein [Rhizobium rhizogenes]